jgi:hypothetical protein
MFASSIRDVRRTLPKFWNINPQGSSCVEYCMKTLLLGRVRTKENNAGGESWFYGSQRMGHPWA